MRKSVIAVLLLSFCVTTALANPPQTIVLAAPGMGGVHLGDPESSIQSLDLRVISTSSEVPNGPAIGYRLRTKNGNLLSITFKDDRAVWIENDWLSNPDDAASLISGLVFGKTTLSDIRSRFKSNGYAYKSMVATKAGDYLARFNCYELADVPGSSLIVVTRAPLGTAQEDARIFGSDIFKLAGIIIARDDYVAGMWGKDEIRDPQYQPVAWGSVIKTSGDDLSSEKESDLVLSTVTTRNNDFSIVLPVGFRAIAPPTGSNKLYKYDDARDSSRLLQLSIDDSPKGTDATGYVDALLKGMSAMHQSFDHTVLSRDAVNGMDFSCSNWTGMKNKTLYGGLVCVAIKSGRRYTFMILDVASRYKADEKVYRQSFESLELNK